MTMLQEIEKRAQCMKRESDYEAEQEAIRKAHYLSEQCGAIIPVTYPKKSSSQIDEVAQSQDIAASRLVRATRDGYEAIKHFDAHTMKNFRLFKMFPKETTLCPKINELTKDLFNQYQLEIVRPNLKYIENNHGSAYDGAPVGKVHFLAEH